MKQALIRYGRPFLKPLGLAAVLLLFVSSTGWMVVSFHSLLLHSLGEEETPIVWEASDGTMLPHTVGHEILEVDAIRGASGDVFYKFNDDLLKIQDYLEKSDPVTFRPGQYEAFPEHVPQFTRLQACKILRQIRGATRKCGYRIIPSQNFFSDGVAKRKLDCDTSAYLFLSVGRLYNLPMKPVVVPGHMFVRFYLDECHYININTNGYLIPFSDREALKYYTPSMDKIEKHIYMTSMDYLDTVSQYMAYVGRISRPTHGETRFKHMARYVRMALKREPDNPYALDMAKRLGIPPLPLPIVSHTPASPLH